MIVRARLEADLARLLAWLIDEGYVDPPIQHTPDADYPYRIELHRMAWAEYVGDAAARVEYDNFKANVDDAHHDTYLKVWSVLRELTPTPAGRPVGHHRQAAMNALDEARGRS